MGKLKKRFKNDIEMLEYLKEMIIAQIDNEKINLKVGDLLKIVEIQKKLSADNNAEQKFWEVIEQIRQEELNND